MKRKILDIIMAVLFLAGVTCVVVFGLMPSAKAVDTEPVDEIVIAIDPGHGGVDPGKVGTNGT